MTSDDGTITDAAVTDHYRQALSVLRELGRVDTGETSHDALLVPGEGSDGVRPWYKSTPTPADDETHDGRGRPYFARADADEVPEEIGNWEYPTVYTTINYQPLSADDWEPYTWENGREWETGRPLPDYGDIQRLALFADVDFTAAAKTRPVDDATRECVEEALDQWASAYADAAGTREAVKILDSVGGTYVMLAPWATEQIFTWLHDTESLDEDTRAFIIEELASRWRAFNADVQAAVSDALPDLDGVFELDGNTNKNRLYKPPLSIHKSLPGVVTPIPTDDISFQFTHLDDVDEAVIDAAQEWSRAFTTSPDDDQLDACAESLVQTLFPDVAAERQAADEALTTGRIQNAESDSASTWRRTLRIWADNEQARRESATSGALNATDPTPDYDLDTDDVTLTSDAGAPFEVVESLNVADVAGDLGIISSSERQDGDDATRIEVNWRSTDSGDSAIVQANNFTDLSDHSGGDAADLVAWTKLGPGTTKPTGWRTNPDHIATVFGKLRDCGYAIPLYVPGRGSSYTDSDGETQVRSSTPNWALAKVARLLDIAPEQAIDDDTDDITIPTLYNRVLAVLEDHDIEHGHEMQDVHLDAEGRDAAAAARDIDVSETTDESLKEPIPADNEAIENGASDADGNESDDSDDTPSTWTARYGIADREFVGRNASPYSINLPGCKSVYWREYQVHGKQTAEYVHITRDKDGEIDEQEPIINADLELVSRLTYPDQPDLGEEWEIRINPTDPREPTKLVTVSPSAFNSPRDFREEIKGESGSMRFDAAYGHKTIDALKTIVNAQDAPRRKAYSRIKLIHSGDEPRLVTPNGTLGPNGWIEEPIHVWGGMEDGGVVDQWELSPEFDDVDTDMAAEVTELLPQTRDHERFLPLLGYLFASTFRVPLTETSVTETDKWNHIQGFGDTGAGKSSIGEVLWETIGMSGDRLLKAKMTPHTGLQTFSSTNAVPLLMDEYKPTAWRDHVAKAFHEHLRDASTGSATSKTWNYPLQKQYIIESSVVLFGEGRFPDESNALARRTIETTLSQRPGRPGTDSYDAFKQLVKLVDGDGTKGTRHHALAWWQFALQHITEKVDLIETWNDARDWGLAEMERRGYDLDRVLDRDMYRQAVQTIVFGVKLWRQFAEHDLGADPEVLPTDEELGDAIEYVVERKNDDNAINRSNKDQFFELAASAASKTDGNGQAYLVHGDHYAFCHEQTDARPTEFRIHLREAVEELHRYVRDYGLEIDVPRKRDIYAWIKDATKNPDDYAISASARQNGVRMAAVNWEMLREQLDVQMADFRPWEDPQAMNESEDESPDDDTDGNDDSSRTSIDATPIAALETEVASSGARNPYRTVTIEVNNWESGAESGPAETGTVEDATGVVDMVDFDGDDYNGDALEAGKCYKIEKIRVGTYKDELQLVCADNTTEVQEIQPGMGHLPQPDTGVNQSLDTAADGGMTTAASEAVESGSETTTDESAEERSTESDGGATDEAETDTADSDDAAASSWSDGPPADAEGPRADIARMARLIEQIGGGSMMRPFLLAKSGELLDIPPERALDLIEKGLTEGQLIEPEADLIETP